MMMRGRRGRLRTTIGRDVSLRMNRILHVVAMMIHGRIVVVCRCGGGGVVRSVRFGAGPAVTAKTVPGILGYAL